MTVHCFTFNPFEENTYILFDKTNDCIIIDPGCNTPDENARLSSFIQDNNLNPVKLVNTHCHIDHVLGNAFVHQNYHIPLSAHKGEIPVLQSITTYAPMYGIPYIASPEITDFIDEDALLTFGETALEIYYTPGHSPASLSFFHKDSAQLIAGDVLFRGSIGRTDLPGGDYDTLIHSIVSKLLPLGDEVVVYSGHGPKTTIGYEKKTNPFLSGLTF